MKNLFLGLLLFILCACQASKDSSLSKTLGLENGLPTSLGSLVISQGNEQNIDPLSLASLELQVTALDSQGEPATDVIVKFSIASGEGAISASEVVTDADGKASVSFTSGAASGVVVVLAKSNHGTVTFRLTVGSTSSIGSMVISKGNNQIVNFSSVAPLDLEVIVLEPNGTPKSGVNVGFSIVSGAGSLNASSSTSLGTGKASVTFTSGATAETVIVLATSTYGTQTFTITVGAQGSGAILISEGSNQTVDPSTLASHPLEVIVLDSTGTPEAGQTVLYTILSGSGTLSSASDSSNGSGRASVNFTAGATSGPVIVLATSSYGSLTFNLTVGNSASGAMVISRGNNQTVDPSTLAPIPLEVFVLDGLGDPESGVVVSYSILSGGGTLSAASATTVGSGKASVTYTTGASNGSVVILARSNFGTVTYNLTNGATGTGSMVISKGNNQNMEPSTAAGTPLEVFVMDASGSAKTGVVVNYSILSGGGSLSGSTATTVGSGKASVTYTSGAGTGHVVVLAQSSFGAVTYNLSVGGMGSMVISKGNNQSVEALAAASIPLEVYVRDSDLAAQSGIAVTYTILSGGGSLSGASATTVGTGKASVTYTAGASTGPIVILASSIYGSVSYSLTIETTDTGFIAISQGNNQTVDLSSASALDLEVFVFDNLGNAKSGIDITYSILSGGGSLSSTSETTGVSGKTAVTYTANGTSGVAVVLASSTYGAVTFNLTKGQTASGSIIISKGNNQTVDQSTLATLPLEVYVMDGSLVAKSGVVINYSILSGGGTLSAASATTVGSGKASVAYTAGATTGPVVILATSNYGAVTFNLSIGLTGVGSSILITQGNGQTVTASSAASDPLEVIALSSTGTPVSGVTINFSIISGNGVLTGGSSTYSDSTGVDGKVSTGFTASATTGSVSVLATSAYGSVTFNLTVGASGGGGGGGPTISFNPTSYSPAATTWLATLVGSTPQKTVTVSNTSLSTIYINSLSTSGAPFTVASDDCPRSPAGLTAGADCDIVIQYTPTTSGTFNKLLFVNWSPVNDGSLSENASFTVQGTGPSVLSAFTGLNSATVNGQTQIDLAWTAIAGATVYRVYRNNAGVLTQVAVVTHPTATYSVTGLTAGTSYIYRVRAVNTANEEDTNVNDMSATTDPAPTAPVLTSVADKLLPSDYINSGSEATVDLNNTNTSSDASMSYTCTYSRSVTGVSGGKSACSGLNGQYGIFDFNATTGVWTWTPSHEAAGTYEFRILGTHTNTQTDEEYFSLNVRNPTTVGSNMIADYQAMFSNDTAMNANTTAWWNDLFGSNDVAITGTANWLGSSSNPVSNPMRLNLNGTTKLDHGNLWNTSTRIMFDLWFNLNDASYAHGQAIMTKNSSTSYHGMRVRTWNPAGGTGSRKVRVSFGPSYRQVVLADNPNAYFRFDEASGTTLNSEVGVETMTLSTTTGNTYRASGALVDDDNNNALFTQGAAFTGISNNSTMFPTGSWSLEFWMKTPIASANHNLVWWGSDSASTGANTKGIQWLVHTAGGPYAKTDSCGAQDWSAVYRNQDNDWHHFVLSYNQGTDTVTYYVNGVSWSSCAGQSFAWAVSKTNHLINVGGHSVSMGIDEFAIYPTALSAPQVANHYDAASGFIRNQALYPANAQMGDKPIAYYRLGESDADTVMVDSSGNQNHGTLTGTQVPYSGVYNRAGGSGFDTDGATQFNGGAGDIGAVKFSPDFNLSNQVTVSFWTYDNGGTVTGRHLWGLSDGTNYSIAAYVNTPTTYLHYYVNGGGSANHVYYNGGRFPVGGWRFNAIVFNGNASLNGASAAQYTGIIESGYYKLAQTMGGTIPSSINSGLNSNTMFRVGAITAGATNLAGGIILDEISVYNRALTMRELKGHALEASKTYCEIDVENEIVNVTASNISAVYNGTMATILYNGKPTCYLRPGVTLTSDTNNIVLGATTNGMVGSVQDFKVYGTSAPSTVGTATDLHTNFYVNSDKYRAQKVGAIKKSGLVLHTEPGSANNGILPHQTVGCPTSELFIRDLSLNAIFGKLKGFTSCGSVGWRGSGISSDPYTLIFNGTSNWVDFGVTDPVSSNAISVCAWTKAAAYGNTATIVGKGISSNSIFLGGDTGGTGKVQFHINGTSNVASTNSAVTDNLWHYFCGTYNGSVIKIYKDGTLQTTTTNYTTNVTATTDRLSMGARADVSTGTVQNYFTGSLGGVQIYDHGLTQAEVTANCKMQAINYSGVTCN